MMKALLLSTILLFMYPGKRQILLFYNNAGTTSKEEQVTILNADKSGLQERDIVIHSYKTEEDKEAVAKWNVRSGKAFTFILVGKDGGEKLRADSVVSLAQLYKTIDAMPMRQDEMKRQK